MLDVPAARGQSGEQARLVPRFEFPQSGVVLERPTQAGTFLDVVGRRAALFGYENETMEVWAYPLKLLKDFRLDFEIENYPVAIDGLEAMARIEVRPEATVLTYTHAAFTVRQILFAPIDEPGLVMLLDVDAARPLRITGSFRPDLRLMWPAGLMTGDLGWRDADDAYTLTEATGRFAAVFGGPLARDVSIQPYQEEPAGLPNRFVMDVSPETAAGHLIPFAIAGSTEGVDAALATYRRLLAQAPDLYRETVDHYRDLLERTVQIDTPDDRLDEAFTWAKVGTDKGLATNPYLGTGFLAGFRTSGASERPGFAWFFGRDALWTALATTAYGDLKATRAALDFLEQFQREDGRIPHEVSQSAELVPWFEDYPYAWASADATPLYVIVHADHWQATGDRGYLRQHWPSIKQAYEFTRATDTDGNALIENTGVGHGWIEGGVLYGAHEEIYMQGLWIETLRSVAELADVMEEPRLAREARALAEGVREATEATYWVEEDGYYAFATRPPAEGVTAANGRRWDEDTVLPAVPLWWHTLDTDRAEQALDHIGSGHMATPWGTRILTASSPSYDPLSYHHGSVWALFTGWASMGAYRYDRPHVGYQALVANALLTYQDALGYVTELLSGDYNTAFGRTSHHQIWSEAMVVTPLVRGLLGLEVKEGGQELHVAPQLPAIWDSVLVERVPLRKGFADVAIRREEGSEGRMVIAVTQEGAGARPTLVVAPAFPQDAQIERVLVDGEPVDVTASRAGDVQRARVMVEAPQEETQIVYIYRPGTSVYAHHDVPKDGAVNDGIRVLRSNASAKALRLVLEGRGRRTYALQVYTSRQVGETDGVQVDPASFGALIEVAFEGPDDTYVRRVVTLPLR